MTRPSTRAVLLAASLAMASACAAPGAEDPASREAEGEAPTTDEEIRATCTEVRLWYVARPEGGCPAVQGLGGRWSPAPAFSEAPPEVRDFACAYRWTARRGVAPDSRALEEALGTATAMAPVCGSGVPIAPVRTKAVEVEGTWAGILGGSVGCDVCGYVWQDKLWVIVSPDKVIERQVGLQLASGAAQAVRLPASRARALVLDLPARPGDAWVPGRVTVW